MSLFAKFNDALFGRVTTFGVGDKVRVSQKIKEGEKERHQYFEGVVIAIRGRDDNKTFTIRKVGEAGVGIEKIYPLSSPHLTSIEVIKKGTRGVRRSKLFYIRGKSPSEIDVIYSRTLRREESKKAKQVIKKRRVTKKRKS